MQIKFKQYYWVLSLLTTLCCLLLFVSFGWSAFATITERPGLNGSMYSYYNLTKLQYVIYAGFVAIAGLCTIFFVGFYTLKKNSVNLKKVFWCFVILVLLTVIFEVYLGARFVGKG